MRKSIVLSVLLALCLFLGACTKASAYADDVSCAELADRATDQIPVNFGYETFGGEHLRYYFENTELPDDVCLRYSAISEDINELGIFHVPDAAAREEVVRLTEEYLARLLSEDSAFIASYAPKELPKLEHAEVKVFGNYVVYAILDDDDRKLVFETVEKELKE